MEASACVCARVCEGRGGGEGREGKGGPVVVGRQLTQAERRGNENMQPETCDTIKNYMADLPLTFWPLSRVGSGLSTGILFLRETKVKPQFKVKYLK
jgi:hypothetical protein